MPKYLYLLIYLKPKLDLRGTGSTIGITQFKYVPFGSFPLIFVPRNILNTDMQLNYMNLQYTYWHYPKEWNN